MNFRVLKTVDKFKWIFEKMGIDYPVMRKILEVKLILDSRRVATISMNDGKKKEGNEFNKSLISYGITGLILLIFLFTPMALFIKMTLILGIMMFMIMTTMISDFSAVLLDVRDKNILLSKPIEEKTVNMAKVVHIFLYLFMITMALAGPTLIVGTFMYKFWFFVVFSLELILIDILVIFLASFLYTVMIKYFDGERVKDVINNFQIVLSLSMIVGYQIMIRMFSFIDFEIAYSPKGWNAFIPPVWFAAPFSMLIDKKFNGHLLIFTILGVVVPIVALVLHVKVMGPYFERNITKLNKISNRTRGLSLKIRVQRIISNIFGRNNQEGVFIRFSQNMLSSERSLKLRIYPMLALGVIFPFIMLMSHLSDIHSIKEIFVEIANAKTYLNAYLGILMMGQIILMISTTENDKAAWIYKTLPLEKPSPILQGSFKGMILKYHLPVFFLIAGIFLLIYGPKILIDLIIITFNMVLLSLIVFKVSPKSLPFSKPFQQVKEGSIVILLITFGFTGGAFGLHLLFQGINYGLYIYLGLIMISIFFLEKSFSKIPWEEINGID